jgi:hypothetical protein
MADTCGTFRATPLLQLISVKRGISIINKIKL